MIQLSSGLWSGRGVVSNNKGGRGVVPNPTQQNNTKN
jgi:hypothetical protein